MNSERMEQLLETLVDQNAELLAKLSEIVSELESVNKELDWLEENSLGKCIVDRMDAMESLLADLKE